MSTRIETLISQQNDASFHENHSVLVSRHNISGGGQRFCLDILKVVLSVHTFFQFLCMADCGADSQMLCNITLDRS